MQAPVDLPLDFLKEAYKLYRENFIGFRTRISCKTRAGVSVTFDRSQRACRPCLSNPEMDLRGGDRIRVPRGQATVIGAYRGKLWYLVDGEDRAWYFNQGELEAMCAVFEAEVLPRPEEVAKEAEMEAKLVQDAAAGSPIHFEEELTFVEFQAHATNSVWTLEKDEELVHLVNSQCDEKSVSPTQLTLTTAHPDSSFAPLFKDAGNKKLIRSRFCVLLSLDRRLDGLLPLVDLSLTRSSLVNTRTEDIHFSSALGSRLSKLRGLIFTRTKQRYWQGGCEGYREEDAAATGGGRKGAGNP